MARLRVTRPLAVAVALSLAIFLIGAAAGYGLLSDAWVQRNNDLGTTSGPDPLGDYPTDFLGIAVRNLSAALFLYSGALTLGISTLLGLGMLSLYVGATVKIGAVASGPAQLLSEVGAYAPVEFAGLVLAATAGLHPLVAGALGGRRGGPRAAVSAYLGAVRTSLVVLAVSVTTIVVAAGGEALVLGSR